VTQIVRHRNQLVDEEFANRILAGRDRSALLKLRGELILKKKLVESQLAEDTAALRETRAQMLEAGMHPREADLRAGAEGDADWRMRCTGACRVLDSWLGRIRSKLGELSAPSRRSAVVVEGAGRTSAATALAINQFLESGCHVFSFGVVGNDLVIVATEPEEGS